MLNALKKQLTPALSPSAEVEVLLDKSRRALVAASTSAAIAAVINDVNGIIDTIDDVTAKIQDEIRQEADNIDRTRTRALFDQKNTVLQLLTEAEGLASKAEAKHTDAIKSEQDSAARALADEGTRLAAELRQLHMDTAETFNVLVGQLDRLREGQNRLQHISNVMRNDMKRADLASFKVIDAVDLGAFAGHSVLDRFAALVRDHSELTALMQFLRKLSEQMKGR